MRSSHPHDHELQARREYPVELDLLLPCSFEACSLMLVVLQRVPPLYGRRPGQPSSSSLARRVCVQSPTTSSFLSASTSSRTPESMQTPLAPIRGQRGHGGVCRLLYAVHQTLSLCSLCSDSPLSSRPQPLGSGGDVAPCEDTREDFGLSLEPPATTYCCRVVF